MKFWRDNQVDQEFEADPNDVARQFIEAVKTGFDISRCRVSVEFAFRWWLSDPKGFHSAWQDEDSDALMDGLYETMTQEERDLIWGKLMRGVR